MTTAAQLLVRKREKYDETRPLLEQWVDNHKLLVAIVTLIPAAIYIIGLTLLAFTMLLWNTLKYLGRWLRSCWLAGSQSSSN